jgi:hypothetical protein
MVCLRNISVDTLHKGDTEDNNNNNNNNNNTDIIVHDNKQGTYLLTDTAVSGYRNVIKIEAKEV